MNPKVDEYLNRVNKWEEEQRAFRRILLECGLTEELKWKHPCYTYNNSNVAIIGGFKEYCSLSFFKGSLLADPENILNRAGENTQSSMILKVRSLKDLIKLEKTIKAYVFEAIEVEKAGLKVAYIKPSDLDLPEELEQKLINDATFNKAFKSLTPGRQKGYILHISSAKQSKTRESRIEKALERIYKGKGFDECICGHSKYMPRCDGSHRKINV